MLMMLMHRHGLAGDDDEHDVDADEGDDDGDGDDDACDGNGHLTSVCTSLEATARYTSL